MCVGTREGLAYGDGGAGRPAFKPFRYDEDFSILADPTRRTQPLDDLKFIALSDDRTFWLSLGGEARTRYEYFREPGFGLRGLSRDDFLLQRLLLHADLHLGEHVRVFAQGVSAWQFGAESPRSTIQDDRLDLQQAFADVILGDPKGDSLTLRAGRMEMSFGSSRLVSAREAANVRLNFDGVRGTLRAGEATIDAFLTRPVEQKLGVANDGEADDRTFWGVYVAFPIEKPGINVDVYYFGLRRENARFQVGTATEERHSLGTRVWGVWDGLDYDVEGVIQFGDFGDRDIRAWTVASNIGYTWKAAAWKPRLGLKANIASGDRDPGDGRLGTFNALFPRQGYFSEINLLAPANVFDVH
ncbi:MAG: alginate export family protein, partial [Phycisphaerales bacterium]|nr:alginate export family protein [Phycisphaerales bacterium]